MDLYPLLDDDHCYLVACDFDRGSRSRMPPSLCVRPGTRDSNRCWKSRAPEPRRNPCIWGPQLAELQDVKKTTMANKGGMVRDLLKIGMMDPEFTHPDLLKDNPLVWTRFLDGLPVDVRRMPL